MKKITLFLSVSLCLAFNSYSFGAEKQPPQAAKSNVKPDQVGWVPAMYNAVLPEGNSRWEDYKTKENKSFAPDDGAVKYGFTYYKGYKPLNEWAGGRPNSEGWGKIVAQGETPYWYDANHDGKVDPAEVKQVPYIAWYDTISNPDIDIEFELPDAEGVYPKVRKAIEEEAAKEKLPKKSGIGDLVYEGRYGWDAQGLVDGGEKMIAVRGPLWIRYLQMKMHMQVGDRYISSSGYEANELKCLVEGTGDKGRKWLAGAELAQLYRAKRADMGETLIQLARDIIAEWDKWYVVPVADGPDLKGLYLNSAEYVPMPADISPELVVKSKDGNLQSSRINYERKGAKDSAAYSASLECKWVDHNAAKTDQPLVDTHTEYLNKIKHAKGYYKVLKENVLPDADESYQAIMEYPGTTFLETIVFRKANLIAEVMSSESVFMLKPLKKKMLKPSMKIAQKILEKMKEASKRRKTAVKPKEVGISLTAISSGFTFKSLAKFSLQDMYTELLSFRNTFCGRFSISVLYCRSFTSANSLSTFFRSVTSSNIMTTPSILLSALRYGTMCVEYQFPFLSFISNAFGRRDSITPVSVPFRSGIFTLRLIPVICLPISEEVTLSAFSACGVILRTTRSVDIIMTDMLILASRFIKSLFNSDTSSLQFCSSSFAETSSSLDDWSSSLAVSSSSAAPWSSS